MVDPHQVPRSEPACRREHALCELWLAVVARDEVWPPAPQQSLSGWLDFAAVVGGALLYAAFVVVATPPNNWDSMTYHLSRAAAWHQRHRVEYVPAHTERQNADSDYESDQPGDTVGRRQIVG